MRGRGGHGEAVMGGHQEAGLRLEGEDSLGRGRGDAEEAGDHPLLQQ